MLDLPKISMPGSMHIAGDRKPQKMQVLFEQWLASSEDWSKSSLIQSMQQNTAFRKKGSRKWFTKDELAKKYNNDYEIAESIIAEKTKDPTTAEQCVRPHPDCPHKLSLTQYLCYDESTETDEEDLVLSSLFRSTADVREKRAKKRKRDSSSESDESSDSSSSASSSSSSESSEEDKKKKKKKSKGKKKSKKSAKKTKKKSKKSKSKKEKTKEKEKKEQNDLKQKQHAAEKKDQELRSKAKKAICSTATILHPYFSKIVKTRIVWAWSFP